MVTAATATPLSFNLQLESNSTCGNEDHKEEGEIEELTLLSVSYDEEIDEKAASYVFGDYCF
jgi:hypothetical protein